METVGAVVSIVQIARLGAQLSLKLYELAEAVGSANKDVQYVAKDIALFSTVLRDLGYTLSRGQKTRLYRDDAYQTSLLIVKDCEEVFKEIQQILKKSGIEGKTTDTISIGRKQKFSWMFYKPRVQILRGNLESLKSTILLQVAVLGYADTVSSSSDPASNGDDFLALKSLVLADETIKNAFEKLKLTEGSSVENPISLLDDATDIPDFESGPPASTKVTAVRSPRKSHPPPSTYHTTFDPKIYTEIWNRVDRLELALRSIETAKWEYERLQINLSKNKHKSRAYQKQAEEEEEKANILRVKKLLSEFGLSKEKVNQALASVVIPGPGAGMRTQTECSVSRNDTLFATLQYFGASWEPDKERHNLWTVKRWMPYYLEDILWEHTAQIFTKAMWRDCGTSTKPLWNIHGSDRAYSAREESQNNVQQAIQYVQQYDADTEQEEHLQGPIDMQQNEIKSLYTDIPGSSTFKGTQDPLPQITRIGTWPDPALSSGEHSKFPPNLSRSSDGSTLDPPPRPLAIKHLSTPWSSENDNLLMLARENGLAWELIATKYFPSKTANTCRKRHERLMEKRYIANFWDDTEVKQLANAYEKCREKMWDILGGIVGERWQDVESKCMEIGLESLQNLSQSYENRTRAYSHYDDLAENKINLTGNQPYSRGNSQVFHLATNQSESTIHKTSQEELSPPPEKSARTSASIPSIVVDFSPNPINPMRNTWASLTAAQIPETNRIPPPHWPAVKKANHPSASSSYRLQQKRMSQHQFLQTRSRESSDPPPLSLGKRKAPAERITSMPEKNHVHPRDAREEHRPSFQVLNEDRVSNIVKDLLRRWTFLEDGLVFGSTHGPGHRERGGEFEEKREVKRTKEF